jgi:hypothetical protein
VKNIDRAICLFILMAAALCTLNAQTKKSSHPAPTATPEKADTLQGSPKVVTATRGVQQFWDIERSLAKALNGKDQSATNKMLSDDFKVWMPNQTGSAVGREDWLASGKENPLPTRVAEMAVQFYEDVVVVKFLGQGKTPAAGKGNPQQYFVVDLWEKSDQGWQLTNRYMSAVTVEPPKNPTGKE